MQLHDNDARMFAEAIGWCKENRWIAYYDVEFSLAAPKGHLPIGGPNGLLYLDESKKRIGTFSLYSEQFKYLFSSIFVKHGLRKLLNRAVMERDVDCVSPVWIASLSVVLERLKDCTS